MRSSLRFLLLASALAVGTTGSAKLRSAAMRLPAELASAERYAVTGRQGWRHVQRIEFADVRSFDLQRSLTKGSDLGLLFYRGSKRRQTFAFSVASGETAPWRVAAATTLRRRAGEIEDFAVEVRNDSGFAAQLQPAESGAGAWTLELSERSEQPLQGWLRRGSEMFIVKGTNRLAGTPLPFGETSGYIFEWGGRAVAAVEVLNDGVVWLSPELAPKHRPAVVAGISALLLLEELRPTLPQ